MIVYMNLNTYVVPVTDEDDIPLNVLPNKGVVGDHFKKYSDRGLLTPYNANFVDDTAIQNKKKKVAAPAPQFAETPVAEEKEPIVIEVQPIVIETKVESLPEVAEVEPAPKKRGRKKSS